MSSGRRKREQQLKNQERQKIRQLKDEFQHNPSGGSKYAQKKAAAERDANTVARSTRKLDLF